MSFLINRPKFFKIILKPEANNLIIPIEFTIKYGRELTDHVFLNVPSGKLWEVKLIKSDDEILFEKGWEKFRDHYSVEFGYFLVFVYDGDSRFSVFMFDRTCTEIEYPFEDNDKETESESDGSVVILDENWKRKTKKSSKGQEGSDGSLKRKLKIQEVTEKSADKLKLDAEGTENDKRKDNFPDQEGGSSSTCKSFTFTKELTLSTAHESDGSVVNIGPNEKELFDDVRRKGEKYMIVASRDRAHKKPNSIPRAIKNEKDDDQIKKNENGFLVGSKENENGFLVGSKSLCQDLASGFAKGTETATMRENCTEIEYQFHDNDKNAGSESDTSVVILENCKTKKSKGKRVVPYQEANDGSVRKKLKTEESAEKMKVDGKITENRKGKNISTDKKGGSSRIGTSSTFTKQVTMSSAYKLEISKEFEKCTGIRVHKQVSVQNMEGVEWPVSIVGKTSSTSILGLCSGWNKFLVDNNVIVGSTISLKFISGTKFQAQVVKPGPNKKEIFGNVRRRGGKYVIIASRDRVKRKSTKVPRTIKSENHDDYQIKEGGGGGGSGVGSKLNVSHVMKTRHQAKLDLLNDFAKKIWNSENERNQVEGQQKKGVTNSYSLNTDR